MPHLLVVGSGPDEEKLKQQGSTIRDAVIHWIGHVEDVAPWYHVSDVYVSPSYTETFGLVNVEAMACGVPVVASAIQGLLEVVEDGVSGLLVPRRDPQALAEAVLRVLTDADLRARLIENGFQRYRRMFTMESMVNSWIAAYSRVLPTRPSALQNETVAAIAEKE